MKIVLILGGLVIIILLLLLYYNDKEAGVNLNEQRAQYEDSLQRYDNVQAMLRSELKIIKHSKEVQEVKDSLASISFKVENEKLRQELRSARTPRVEKLIETEPELRYYIAYYDSLTTHQAFRIDTLEIEKRIEREMCSAMEGKYSKLLDEQDSENAFLRAEVDKRDEQLKKLEKKVKRRTVLAGFFALLNLIPRN